MGNTTVFGTYRVSTGYDGVPLELGRSPLGVVTYKAQDSESSDVVALKVIPTSPFESATLERLQKHVDQARVVQHANIARVLHFSSSADRYLYAREYVEGESASCWVKQHGPMPLDAALRIALQVAQALSAAAFHLSPHRAINPRNLLLAPGQTPTGGWPFIKLIDFGLAEIEFAKNGGLDPTNLPNDAPLFYRSPEEAQRGRVDIRSDIYSLGCTLWFLLTGAPPFKEEGAPILEQAVATEPPARQLNRLPKPTRVLLSYMLRRDPEERPLDPLVLIQEIERSLARVERRQTLARRLGMSFLAPTYVKRVNPVKPVAELRERRRAPGWIGAVAGATALFIALAVLPFVFRSGQTNLRSVSRQKPIGVPIGVPDGSGPRQVVKDPVADVEPPSTPEPTAQQAIAAPTPAAVAAADDIQTLEPPVHTAQPIPEKPSQQQQTPPLVASAEPNDGASPSPVTAVSDRRQFQAAADSSKLAENSTAHPLEATTAPPAEGPEDRPALETASVAPAPTPIPMVEGPDATSSSRQAVDAKKAKVTRAPGSNKRRAQARVAASKRKPSRSRIKLHEVRRALPPDSEKLSSIGPSRIIRGNVVGTTPEGNWIVRIGRSRTPMVIPPPPGNIAPSMLQRGVPVALPPN